MKPKRRKPKPPEHQHGPLLDADWLDDPANFDAADPLVCGPLYTVEIAAEQTGDIGPGYNVTTHYDADVTKDGPQPVEDQPAFFPLEWFSFLREADDSQRSRQVERWRAWMNSKPIGLWLRTLIPQTHAARLLAVAPAYLSKLADENRLRSIRLQGGSTLLPGGVVQMNVRGKSTRLLAVADCLACAANRIRRLSNPDKPVCPDCDQPFQAGSDYEMGDLCPKCAKALSDLAD